jgi:hypothetical protein
MPLLITESNFSVNRTPSYAPRLVNRASRCVKYPHESDNAAHPVSRQIGDMLICCKLIDLQFKGGGLQVNAATG